MTTKLPELSQCSAHLIVPGAQAVLCVPMEASNSATNSDGTHLGLQEVLGLFRYPENVHVSANMAGLR